MLINAFDPPLNFRLKTLSTPPEPQTDQQPNNVPPAITAKIQQLLTSGIPSTDILKALNSLSQPPNEVKAEPTPTHEIKSQPQPDLTPQVDNAIIKHLEALTQSITTLKEEVNQRIDTVETKLKQPQKVKETSPKSENKDAQIQKKIKGTASLDQLPKQPESTRGLAKRWQISEKTLTRQRQRYENRPDGFFQYSLSKEQGQFGWIYDANNQLFYAVTELPKNLKKSETPAPDSTMKFTKDATKDFPKPLTAEQLGHRFRNPQNQRPISGRGIEMALKRHKDPDDFAKYCQERDPNGYGWQFDEQQKLFLCTGKATTQIHQ